MDEAALSGLGPIDELVLDWNGTVMNDLERCRHATLSVLGLPPESLSVPRFRASFELPLASFFVGLGVADSDLDVVERRWNHAMRSLPAALNSGVRSLLETCRQHLIPVGIVTGADAELVGADVNRLGLHRLVEWVEGPVTEKTSALVAARAGDRRIAFAGDTVHDVEHAKAAGVIAIAFTGGYTDPDRLVDARPDVIVDDLGALTALLPRERLNETPASALSRRLRA